MSEKTLGQVLWEVFNRDYEEERFCNLTSINKTRHEQSAQAVIAEYLRRNGEPVGWQWFDGNTWADCSYFTAHGFKEELSKDCRAVYAAPQPLQLPTIEEIADIIYGAIPEEDEFDEEDSFRTNLSDWSTEVAIDVLELLKGKK